MKRVIRAIQATGERMERLEVHGDDFVVVLAKRDAPPQPEDDLIEGLDGEALASRPSTSLSYGSEWTPTTDAKRPPLTHDRDRHH
jgi:hypothetical protein